MKLEMQSTVSGLPSSEKLVGCRICGQVHVSERLERGQVAECSRCGSEVTKGKFTSIDYTGAFTISALLLFLPANIFPIMRMNLYGMSTDNTVWQGVVKLYQDGDAFIAIVVFLASMFIPFLKLLGLLYLVVSAKFNIEWGRRFRTAIYRFIEAIGRWAMLDVFVLAILVSLVKLNRMATIIPGSGVSAFSCVVFFTILASNTFDPHVLWEKNHVDT